MKALGKIVRQSLYTGKQRVLQAYGLLTHSFRLLPHFVIIGTQKGGTSSLYTYLSQHPCVVAPAKKEVHFFDLNFHKGLAWYRAHFPTGAYVGYARRFHGRKVITGEASPYYMFHPRVPQRLAQAVPGAKLIALLRHPVDRAYSHYGHEVRAGLETLSFEEALEREHERLRGETEKLLAGDDYYSFNHHQFSYLARGLYVDQLKTWFELFPREQVCLLRSEDFFADPAGVFQQVLRFLNLPAWDLGTYPAYNPGDATPMPSATRKKLVDYFAPHNQRLREFVGRDFQWDN